jgi:heptaprenyl diphosphate synthase
VRASKLAVLGALCIFLSTVEYMIPKPLPFVRLGLANVPLILALGMPAAEFALLVFIKIVGQALISGTLFSYVFLLSFAGTLISAAVMFALRRAFPERLLSLAGISIAGAFLSNLTQIALARFFILGPAAIYIAPPLIVAGLATGTALGIFCENFARKSRWYANESLLISGEPGGGEGGGKSVGESGCVNFRSRFLFIAGLCMAPALLVCDSWKGRLLQFAIFFIFAVFKGRAGNILITGIVFAGIAFCNTLFPYGKVLYEIGSFRITAGALGGGVEKAATVEGLIMLSRITINAGLRLPGRAGRVLGEAFTILPFLSARKKTIHAKTFIADLDNILLELDGRRFEESADAAGPGLSIKEIAITAMMALLVWLPAVLQLLR